MLKKLLQGFAFGTGFAIAAALVYMAWITWVLPPYIDTVISGGEYGITSRQLTEQPVSEPPVVTDRKRFLGSLGSYSGDFLDHKNGELSPGEGEIVGMIRANGHPAAGLKIRLALNGSVMSQWSVSDQAGQYTIAVPYGRYRVDGFEIDPYSANLVLAGMIDHPNNPHAGSTFEVSPKHGGEGLVLDYVDPVVKLAPRDEISKTDEVVARWEPYPKASRYVVQLYENERIHDFVGQNRVFPWSQRPTVTEPEINLTTRDVPLKTGYYYTLEIIAEDDKGRVLSQSAHSYTEKDFRVVD